MQAQQYFKVCTMHAGNRWLQRVDGLCHERELVMLKAEAQPLYPFHVPLVTLEHTVEWVVDRDAIASAFFGMLAGTLGHAQQGLCIRRALWMDVDHTNADTCVQIVLAPLYVQVMNEHAQPLCRLHGCMGLAVVEHHCKFVTTNAGQYIAFTHGNAQLLTDFAQDFIASSMPVAGIDDLEVVQIKVQQRAMVLAQRLLQVFFKGCAIVQTRQHVVALLPGQHLHVCLFL